MAGQESANACGDTVNTSAFRLGVTFAPTVSSRQPRSVRVVTARRSPPSAQRPAGCPPRLL